MASKKPTSAPIENAPAAQVEQTITPAAPVEQTAGSTPSEEQPGNEPVAQILTYDEFLAKIKDTKLALNYPVAKVLCKETDKLGDWEADFTAELGKTGVAIGRLTDLKLTTEGTPQIWLRGIVVREILADVSRDPAAQEVNPNGYCYSLRPGSNENGFEGFRSVIGFPFCVALSLTPKAEGKQVSGAEMGINQLGNFGYTGETFKDFVPAKSEPSVLASTLGMDNELQLEFSYKPANGDFPARIQLSRVSAIEYRVTVSAAEALDDQFGDLLFARKTGRIDTRKKSVEGTKERALRARGLLASPPVSHGGTGSATNTTQQTTAAPIGAIAPTTGTATTEPVQTAPTPGKCGQPIHGGKFCNRLPGHDKPSKDAEGKVVGATPCSTIPF